MKSNTSNELTERIESIESSESSIINRTITTLNSYRLVKWVYALLLFKFFNHVFCMIDSLHKVIYAFYSQPVSLHTLVPFLPTNTAHISLWPREILKYLATATNPHYFQTLTLHDLKSMWSANLGQTVGNVIKSPYMDYFLQGGQMLGIFDYETTLIRTNTKINEINTEMVYFFKQRDLLVLSSRVILHLFVCVFLLVLLCQSIRQYLGRCNKNV